MCINTNIAHLDSNIMTYCISRVETVREAIVN